MEILNEYKIFAQAFFHFWWIILPPIFYMLFKFLWLDFVFDKFAGSLEWVVLEIIPPKEIEKSPKITESIFLGLSGVVAGIKTSDLYIRGIFTDQFSFELVGREGSVHFYVRTQKKWRNLVEAQIYAQFPEAEIVEVEDYTQKFPKSVPNNNWNLWGSDFELVMPDPYPIKTYDKFEETITGTMIDPLAAMAEVLGRLGPGQHIWLQYILSPQSEAWRKDELKLIDKLAKKAEKKTKGILDDLLDVFTNLWSALWAPVEFAGAEKANDQPVEFKLTPGEKEVLKAVEENFGKNAFRTKMRMVYLGRRDGFSKANVGAFIGAIKQFNDLNLNSFKPNDASKTSADYMLEDKRIAFRQRKIYNRYRNRSMDGATFILTTKELATVFHFPDMGVKAPSLTRIESKRGAAPVNLPIG